MTIKFNSNNDCYDSCFSESLLSTCKKATTLAVKPRQSESPDAAEDAPVLCDNEDVIEIMSLWVWLLGVVWVWLFVLEIQFRKLAPM